MLGGSSSVSSSDPLAGVYDTLLYQDTQALPLQAAIDTSAQTQTAASAPTGTVQSAIDSYNSVLNNNNQTLLANAQTILAANNGTLPLTA